MTDSATQHGSAFRDKHSPSAIRPRPFGPTRARSGSEDALCLAIIKRGGGMSFFEKARRAQEAGAHHEINQDDRPCIAHHEATDRRPANRSIQGAH